MINPVTNRLHTVFSQVKNNGRLGSGGGTSQRDRPNMQNAPRKNEIRKCYSDGLNRSMIICD